MKTGCQHGGLSMAGHMAADKVLPAHFARDQGITVAGYVAGPKTEKGLRGLAYGCDRFDDVVEMCPSIPVLPSLRDYGKEKLAEGTTAIVSDNYGKTAAAVFNTVVNDRVGDTATEQFIGGCLNGAPLLNGNI